MQEALDGEKANAYASNGDMNGLFLDTVIGNLKQKMIDDIREQFSVRSTSGYLMTMDDED